MIEAVLWDNDGVLLDTEALFFETTRVAFARLGLDLTKEIWGRHYLGEGKSSREIAAFLGADSSKIAVTMDERNQHYRQILGQPPPLRPQVRETLAGLSGRVRMAIVTGSQRDQLKLMHSSSGLLDYFEAIVTGDECTHAKPHPEPYLAALKILGVRAGNCIAIEDSPRGLASARAAGVACIVVPTELTQMLEFVGALSVEQDVSAILKHISQTPLMKTTSSPRYVSRRSFLASAGTVATFLALPSHVLGLGGEASPNSQLNVAGIGVGGQGGNDINEMSSENIVALCDVDWDHAAHMFAKYPRAKRYKDFREMLDQEKSIDAVVVGTPDHAHAVVSIEALRRGKHVYCEKPLTRTVHEARAVAKAAKEAKVATQMGNQGMAFEGNRLINEWLWDGAIGQVREAHVWSDRPTHRGKMPLWWAQGIERPKDTPPVPQTLDWDLWLGPAPYRPYHSAYAPFRWRGWWDFGSGGLGDMGIHNLAPVFSALKLGAPESVQASSTPVFPETVPLAAMVHYQFPARGELPPVKLHWYDGGLLPERPAELEENRELDPEDGIIFVGDKGKMIVTGWGGEHPRLLPASLDKDYRRPAKSLPRSIGHYQEWIAACKTGSLTRSNFEFAGPLTEAVLLGSVCIRNGGDKLVWDSPNLKITNDPEANKYLHYEYRQGWRL